MHFIWTSAMASVQILNIITAAAIVLVPPRTNSDMRHISRPPPPSKVWSPETIDSATLRILHRNLSSDFSVMRVHSALSLTD